VRWIACLLLLAGCQQTGPVAQHDGLPTIVSLNPCADAVLAEVADKQQLLAISHYSRDSASTSMPLDLARSFHSTSGAVEEVLALQPDVVVAGSFLAPATRAAFERLGMRVETVDVASNFGEARDQVRTLAALAGHTDRGEELVARIDAALEASAGHGAPIDTLLWQEGGIVPGPESLVAAILDHSGFALHSAARGLGQGAYLPLEQVLADPPHLLLTSSDERMLSHPVLGQLSDMRHESFDPSLFYCAGPSVPRALERLADIREGLS